MANEVYANSMEVSCKSADGKSVACFPDVCFTPPQAPPTPPGVPIPYPNTGMAKDTHGQMHAIQNTAEKNCMDPDGDRSQMGGKDNAWNYGAAKKSGIFAHQKTFPASGKNGKPCSEECLEAQLDNYHKQVGVSSDKTPLRADRSPLKEEQKTWGAQQLDAMDED